MDSWKLRQILTEKIIDLADDRWLTCISYPSDIARALVDRIEQYYSSSVHDWIILDPVKYFPSWSIYKTIANGFSWKGRKRGLNR